MNRNKPTIIAERGTNMKETHLIAILVGIVAVGLVAADASAYYHPTLGRFLSRDPGSGDSMRIGVAGPATVLQFIPRDPVGRYRDGMNLYQYVQSNPITRVDPDGLWGRETHYGKGGIVMGTYDIADKVGFNKRCAEVLAAWNQGVDDMTSAVLFPQYHFDPGRAEAYTRRWNRGVKKLNEAKVWFGFQPSVYDGLARIGEALHSYQDGFSHTAKHHADTPWKHITGPNSGPYGDLVEETRFHKKRTDSRVHVPDDPDLWPEDHQAAVTGTTKLLQEIWKIPSVQCYCKKK